jgi:hypothetical protein
VLSTVYGNTNVVGGTSVESAATLSVSSCLSTCLGSSTCVGFDWDPANPAGNWCWLTSAAAGGNWAAWHNGTSIGVTHFVVDRNVNCRSTTS